MQTEQKIIERLKKIPPQYLDGVLSFIDSILEQPQEQSRAEIRSIQNSNCRYKGEELLKRLLESRSRTN